MTARTVRVVLPRALSDVVGERELTLPVDGSSVRDALDALVVRHPALGRRLRDERGALRRYVNVYVDGADIRREGGLDTAVADGAEITVLPSVAGG